MERSRNIRQINQKKKKKKVISVGTIHPIHKTKLFPPANLIQRQHTRSCSIMMLSELTSISHRLGCDAPRDNHLTIRLDKQHCLVPSTPLAMESSSKFNLMGFPLEIRNLIYSYVLTFPGPLIRISIPIRPRTFFAGEPPRTNNEPCDLALLRVSKSTEHEAAPVFYESNTFQLQCRFMTTFLDEDGELKEFDSDIITLPDVVCIGITKCVSVEIPDKYMSSLRRVSLVRPIPSHWPDRRDMHPDFVSRGEPELPSELDEMSNVFDHAISFLATNSNMITFLSLEIQMLKRLSYNDWDTDPSMLLCTIDPFRKTAHAVSSLVHLKQLQIWKTRRTFARVGRKEKVCDWMPVEERELHRVRREHYPQTRAIYYCRKRLGRTEPEMHRKFTEGFLIELK